MSSHGNGHFFKVHYSQAIIGRLAHLQEQATEKGQGLEFLKAFRALHDRLHKQPQTVGDPVYTLAYMKLTVYIAAVRPLVFHYGVHWEKPHVFIKTVCSF